MVRIVTDVLFFCFFFFSLLLGSHSIFLSHSPFPPPPPPCPASMFCCLSWRFCTTDSVSPAPSTALPNPASRPSTPTKYWLLSICSVSPLPRGVSHRVHVSAAVKLGAHWGCCRDPFHTKQGAGGCKAAWPFSLAQPPAVRTSRGLCVWPCGMECGTRSWLAVRSPNLPGHASSQPRCHNFSGVAGAPCLALVQGSEILLPLQWPDSPHSVSLVLSK